MDVSKSNIFVATGNTLKIYDLKTNSLVSEIKTEAKIGGVKQFSYFILVGTNDGFLRKFDF